jgi:hypothetical protein
MSALPYYWCWKLMSYRDKRTYYGWAIAGGNCWESRRRCSEKNVEWDYRYVASVASFLLLVLVHIMVEQSPVVVCYCINMRYCILCVTAYLCATVYGYCIFVCFCKSRWNNWIRVVTVYHVRIIERQWWCTWDGKTGGAYNTGHFIGSILVTGYCVTVALRGIRLSANSPASCMLTFAEVRRVVAQGWAKRTRYLEGAVLLDWQQMTTTVYLPLRKHAFGNNESCVSAYNS